MVEDAPTLAHGRVWPRRRRDYRQRRRAQGIFSLRSQQDHHAGETIMNDLAQVTTFAKRYAEAWCSLVTSLISGYELWKIDNDGLVAESKGHFDADDYAHQA